MRREHWIERVITLLVPAMIIAIALALVPSCKDTSAPTGGGGAPAAPSTIADLGLPPEIDPARIDPRVLNPDKALVFYTEYYPDTGTVRIVAHRGRTPEGKYERHGPYVQYYKDGKTVEREGQYTYGQRTGMWKFYDQAGKLINSSNMGGG